MPAQAHVIIAKCSVVGRGEDPAYRQSITCGRHEMIGDEPPKRGGQDAGPAPFEYLLAALGSCTSITLRMYAERKGWPLASVSVTLEVLQEGDARKIVRRVAVSGALDESQVARLSEVVEKTPVTLVVKAGAEIRTTLSMAAA